MLIRWRGEYFDPAYLANHYRKMADRQPNSAGFWRGLARQVIAQARAELALDRRAAA